MEIFNQIFSWLSEHEAGLSALAALVVIVGVTLSPMGSGLRRAMGRHKDNAKIDDSPTPVEPDSQTVNSVANRFSVAVLPFENMSDDKDQEYIADGLTEDLITDLSLDSRLFVIARNSTFAYKNTSRDIREIGRELGVRYVVEGSLRRMGDNLRITAQLIETESGTHVWADRIDRPFNDFFAAQDDITNRIVTALCSHLNMAERERFQRQNPEDLDAWELCVRAETGVQRGINAHSLSEGEQLVRAAIKLEPNYARAWALLGYIQAANVGLGISTNTENAAAQALESAAKGQALAPSDPLIMAYRGFALVRTGNAEEGLQQLRNSLERNPNFAFAQSIAGSALVQLGRASEAIEELDKFLLQNPRDPMVYNAYFWRGWAYLALGELAKAETSIRKGLGLHAEFHIPWLTLGAVLHEQGKNDEAKKAIAKARHLEPRITLDSVQSIFETQLGPELTDQIMIGIRQHWAE